MSTPTATPTCGELSCDECNARTATLETELARLRALFPAICSALGNGAFCTPDVSIGFLESIPNEVASVVARLRAELSAVQAQHLHEVDELAAQAKIMNELRTELGNQKVQNNHNWQFQETSEEALKRAEIAENWSDHHAAHADDLIAENVKLRAEVERLKGLASWANTCIHHNDAERARYGHVCLVCTSTRAEKAEKLWKEFITLMEITEESDSGNAFNPNKISSCRAMDGKRLNEILIEARQIVF